jgi:hypothetical protein
MNTTILFNATPLSFGSTYYVESVCSKYITDLNQYLFYIALLNLLYFLIIRRILNMIPDIDIKIAHINIDSIFENVIILSNVFICGYYIIFNYNTFIMNNLIMILFIVKVLLSVTILIMIYANKDILIKIFSYAKENIKESQEEKQNENEQESKDTKQ